jgi:hypothetical protein
MRLWSGIHFRRDIDVRQEKPAFVRDFRLFRASALSACFDPSRRID